MTTKKQALDFLKGHTTNTYWNVCCFCKKCTGLPFQKITVEDMADRMVASDLDFTKPRSFNTFCHRIVSA